MFYLTATPWWLKSIFPRGLTWQGNPGHNTLYLTFDDGPHPEITGFVLEQLAAANAKGTFFCIGENVERYPATFESIKREGHSIGNHTQTHPDGWKMNTAAYLDEVVKADQSIGARLFRPPYGKITSGQARAIRQKFEDMQVIMWTGVSGDFDTRKSGNWCAKKAIRFARPGSIIVFHDSEKAWPRLKVALPAVLHYMEQQGLQSAGL